MYVETLGYCSKGERMSRYIKPRELPCTQFHEKTYVDKKCEFFDVVTISVKISR